jgi:TolB-like protein/DNA-binding winged helix-turn-helix (wHTH) protein/Tfp pilus assembly protein PilF
MSSSPQTAPAPIRFGVFELDLKSGELRKNGSKLRIEGQPLQILAMLLERPGEVVTREELKQRLWAEDTFVDFEHGINTGIRRLREALNDSADTPRYIETLPRRGYRFIYPLAAAPAAAVAPAGARWRRAALLVASLVAAALLLGILFRGRLFPPTADITSVAVLPLQNLTGDPEQDYLPASFTEILITELGRHSALRVPSHQTMSQYSGTRKPMPEIAREQEVDSVIEGKLMRQGNRVRITINFIQMRPERHLISERYDGEMSELFLLQDEVAQDILAKIRSRMTPEQRRGFAQSRALDPHVTEAYLKGLFLSGPGRGRETYQSTPDRDRAKALEYFQQVVEKAPDFAPAYARMALLQSHGGREARAKARQMALKALEIDDSQAEAHVALAWLEFTDWDFAGAEREFQRAIELNPNLAVARIWYVSYLMCLLRFEEADAQSAIALRLNPASADTLSHVANNYLFSGRVEKAIELHRKALELEPAYGGGHWGLGRAYYVRGNYDESVTELEKAIAERGRTLQNLNLIAAAYIKAGRRKEGLAVLRELEGQWKERGGAGSGMGAFVYAALGDKDKAFARLETAFERGGTYLIALLADPMYEPLRSDRRFHDLVRRVGFPPDSLRRAGVPTEDVAPVATGRLRTSK